MMGNFTLRCLAVVYTVVLLAGLVILLWPEQPASPLVDRDGWKVTGGFFTGSAPNALEARQEILTSPATVCWRSWSPATQASSGRVESAAFMAPPFVAIPVGGFPNEAPGMEIYLQKLDTGERLAIANARMNNQWSQVDLHLPDRFRSSPVRLVAESASTRKYVSVGTPFKISRASYLKSRLPSLLAVHALALGYFMLIVFACQVLASRFVSDRYGFPLGLGCVGLVGFLAFFVYYRNPGTGRHCSAAVLLGSIIVVLFPRLRPVCSACLRSAKDYYAVWFLVSLFYVLVLYMVDTGAGSWHANSRFLPVRWSSDNQFPMVIAEQIFQGNPITELFLPWHVSDRPPLLAGLMALARRPLEVLITAGLPNSMIQYFYHIFGIAANSLWAPVLLFGLRRSGISEARSLACTLVAMFLPFTIFNSIYCWPKMLGGSLALLSFVVLFDGFHQRRQTPSRPNVPFYIAALLAALALLSHSGTVFGLLVIALWPLAVRYLPAPRHLLGVSLLAVAVVLPWLRWQRRVDPPGDTLTKYALTGSFHFNEPPATFLQTVQEAYGKLTFPAWLTLKKECLGMLLGVSDAIATSGLDEMAVPKGSAVLDLPQRVRGFFFLLPSLGLLPLALVAFAASRKNRKEAKRFALILPPGFLPMLAVGLVSLAVTVLAMWPPLIVHLLPYQVELEIILALLLLLASSSRPWAGLTGLLIISHGLLVWIIGPISSALRYDLAAFVLLALLGLWAIAWVRAAFRNEVTPAVNQPPSDTAPTVSTANFLPRAAPPG